MVTQQVFLFGLFRNLHSFKVFTNLQADYKYKKNAEYSFLRYEISSMLRYLHVCTSYTVQLTLALCSVQNKARKTISNILGSWKMCSQ